MYGNKIEEETTEENQKGIKPLQRECARPPDEGKLLRPLKETVKKVFWYIIVGVGIGALIHNWIPAEIIQKVLGLNNPFSVLIATFIGIPMYADIFGTIPIAEALFAKGVGVGTILSFMMGVTALSLPSIIMLKKVVQNKLLVTFVGIVAAGIIIIGYSFNAFGYLFI